MVARVAVANPANQAALQKHFGSLMPEHLRSCALCHVADHAADASSLEEFPHNAFGAAVRIAGERLLEDGKDDAIPNRFQVVANRDADGDGHSNLVEILLGSRPGSQSDIPDQDSLSRQASLIESYQAKINQYAWRPFAVVQRPPVPRSRDCGNNPIDAFIQQQRNKLGLAPNSEAKPEQLLRRVYLDLIGLSPTREEINAFVRQYSGDRSVYERVVDRLLQHPGYGERWGRHWMDVWRYSDWAGYKQQLRESQHHIWHWRDWVVESLNEDKGYDQMVLQMLAADEMQLDDAELRATGFLARNYFTNRDQWMDNVVKHTSQAFMGMTVGCAKCHNHMSDPIEQTEYYGLRAVFESYNVRIDRLPGELDTNNNGIPRAYDQTVGAKTYLFERGDERFPVKENPILPAVPKALGGQLDVREVKLSRFASHPDQRPFVIKDLLRAAKQEISNAKHEDEKAAAEKAYQALDAELTLEAQLADGLSPNSAEWKTAARRITALQRDAEKLAADLTLKEAKRKLESATAELEKSESAKNQTAIVKAKRVISTAQKAVSSATQRVKKADDALKSELTTKFNPRKQQTYPDKSSGRRLAFARWLTNRQNPLTARVAVNHIWLRHFGRGIVPTVNDFGAAGREPTHPALLDWLAAEFMDTGWSMKRLHRLIVMSSTYRMASTSHATNRDIDPDNEYYWRGPLRRMEGEIVRDNLLHLAGRLDATMGGPDIDHQQAQSSRRRSIYLRHAHEKLVEFVQIFDGPAVSECYMRETSIQPHQALALANSKLSVNAAQSVVSQLSEFTGTDDCAFVEHLFLQVLSRPPSDEETKLCLHFLSQSTQPRYNLVLVLLNHNDFVSIR